MEPQLTYYPNKSKANRRESLGGLSCIGLAALARVGSSNSFMDPPNKLFQTVQGPDNLLDRRELTIPLMPLKPTGELSLPTVEAVMREPYFDPTFSRLVAAAAAIEGGIELLLGTIGNKGKPKISRRQFLRLTAAASASALALSVSGVEGIRNELMRILSPNIHAYSLVTDVSLLRQYYLREKKGEANYNARKDLDDVLGMMPGKKIPVRQNGKQVGLIHDFRLRSIAYLQSLGQWLPDRSDKMNNTHLMVYELHKGALSPQFHSDPAVVASRFDEMHEQTNAPMLALFNATAPQALGMCKAIEITQPSPTDPYVSSIIYGSSSIFIPRDIPSNSPIWDHARTKITTRNPYFKELSFRPDDPSHQAIGFGPEGNIRLVSQKELLQIIERKVLPLDLDSVALNQFCYDPRTQQIPDDFEWSADIHRNLNVLLVTEDGRQMVASSTLDYFFTNGDYDGIIHQLEKHLRTTFKIVCCLDVGLASGFMIENEYGNMVKPVEPGFNDPITGLHKGLSHTSSIYLVQKI